MHAAHEVSLIGPALAGDEEAFRRLVEPHYRALHLHCYRMLGSLHDAEDLVQETLLRAWRRLGTFEGRASFRAWLYRIATNACLDALDRRSRRVLPAAYGPAADPSQAPAPPLLETIWLEPYPDRLLDLVDEATDPQARYDARESVELAFLAAIQYLPPRQRAVLILRDVLGWAASEVAELLASSVASVNSALQRARATLEKQLRASRPDGAVVPTAGEPERALLARYVRAWEEADVSGLVALLKQEAILSMPPFVEWYDGRAAIATFFSISVFGDGPGRLRLEVTRANRQPAFAVYERDPQSGSYQAFALKVLTVHGGLISEITGFADPGLFPLFGLATTLPS